MSQHSSIGRFLRGQQFIPLREHSNIIPSIFKSDVGTREWGTVLIDEHQQGIGCGNSSCVDVVRPLEHRLAQNTLLYIGTR